MILNLSKNLFWDTDLKDIDEEAHAHFIIKRIVHRGTFEDWKIIRKHYGMNRLKNEIINIRDMDKKSLSLFSLIFDTEKEKFRCYSTKQWIA